MFGERGGGYMDICNMEPSWTDKEIGSSERYGTGLTPLNLWRALLQACLTQVTLSPELSFKDHLLRYTLTWLKPQPF